MTAISVETVHPIVHHFAIDGECIGIEPHHRGHIHDTFISTWRQGEVDRRYLHQKLNDRVFTDIPALMHNVERVTCHLAARIAQNGDLLGHAHTLELVLTHDGRSYLSDQSGLWRTYRFIEGTTSFDLCDGEERAYEAARAFGQFQRDLLGFDVATLRETIPDFFSSPHRLRQFEAALARNVDQRAAAVVPEIRFVQERRDMVDVMEDALADSRFPARVVHGDTKLNNVLFDARSGRAVCIIDLDTCMRGYSLYDFGDLVRFTAAVSAEDEVDLAAAGMDLTLYRALVSGYLEGTRGFLTPYELELMPFAARLVTFTIGLRFLTDHLSGDVYFKTSRPGHNLDRARVQFAMVESMERQAAEMAVP